MAVVAGSRVTMPYATTLLTLGLMHECFGDECRTLGEAFLHAKQAMLKKPPAEDRLRASLDALAAALSPAPQLLAAERAEHVLLFNLLGDPLLRLHRPRQLTLKVAATAAPGESLSVAGNSPVDGRATVELVVPRDRLTFAPPPRDACPQTSEGLAELQETYARANDHRLASVEVPVREGHFTAELKIPAGAAGRCHICVAVEGADDFALGFGGGEDCAAEEGSGKAIEIPLSLRERVGVRAGEGRAVSSAGSDSPMRLESSGAGRAARMVELADTQDLGSCPARGGSSNLPPGIRGWPRGWSR